ncbi:MAG: hypothetical protein R2830_26015 [Saprospiraceae bacterium]
MPNWTDKDTDKLFQQGSEQFDFEYNPAAWEQMDRMLDKDKRRRWLIWWASGIIGAVAIAVVVFFLWGKERVDDGSIKPNIEESRVVQNKPEQNQAEAGGELESADFQQNSKHSEAAQKGRASGYTKQKTGLGETGKQEPAPAGATGHGEERKVVFYKKPSNQRKLSQGISEGATKESKAQAPPAAAESGSRNEWDRVQVPAEPAIADGEPDKGTLAENGLPSRPDDRAALLPGLTFLPVPSPYISHNGAVPSLTLPLGEWNSVMVNGGISIGNELIIGIGGGPELNSVGFGDFSRLNWKFGLHLEYRYRERFGLGIGASYLRMKYVAGKGEFQLPETFPNLDKLVATRGTCDMLEVPIEISYFLGGHRHSGLFGTLGVASYFLFSEDYIYDYTYYNPNHINRWSTNENGNYWFGIGALSVGYNSWVSERLAVRFAPYAQFPLRGVGHGDVKLYGIGVSLRLEYALIK